MNVLDRRIGELTEERNSLRAEVERLKALIDDAGKPWIRLDPGIPWEGAIDAAMAAACAEVEKLRADVVWAVRRGVEADHNEVFLSGEQVNEDDYLEPVVYDGTDASLLSAVRRAREERTDGE